MAERLAVVSKMRRKFAVTDVPPTFQPQVKVPTPVVTTNNKCNEISAQHEAFRVALQSSTKFCTPQRERQARFALLCRVVNYLKKRHLEGLFEALSVDEILDELFIRDELKSNIVWLETEALPSNPKIGVAPAGKFYFKPRYDIRNRMDLYRLLKHFEVNGLGGIEYDDIAECVKDADKVVRSLGDTVFDYTNPKNKKRVIYFNDKSCDLEVSTDLKEMWRSVGVEGVDVNQIQEYLTKHGLTAMSGDERSRPPCQWKKRKLSNRPPRRQVEFKFNSHVKDILLQFPLVDNP
nr:transcription initiation factor IIE subunit [Hymenolepis microstoma]